MEDILMNAEIKAENPVEAQQHPGRIGPIGKEQIAAARQTLEEYKRGKANLERRIIANEQWWKLRHWEQIGESKNPGDPEPTSAWLFNSIANKHADAMDNYPKPVVLPREAGDQMDAEILSEILPVILEQEGYEQTYSDVWWYKLKSGTGVTAVFWNSAKNNGLGDIDIVPFDLLNLFWEPGIKDIQKSKNLFSVELVDADVLKASYPFLDRKLSPGSFNVASYQYDDTVDVTKKTVVVDWYYKRNVNGKDILHYCKFVEGEVLYATENDPNLAERGIYDHGKYPFVFDTLFPAEGTPTGFSYVDVCKSPQTYIDKLDQAILKNAITGARPRFFVRGDSTINEKEYADWTRDFIHYKGSGNPNESIMPVDSKPLPDIFVNVRELKVEELKETSGNRDFSQGGTSSGVTAASAIAALQEAGSKLSRDMIKSAYRAFAEINILCIELIRQFYNETRFFRIIGQDGAMKFVQFNGQQIAMKAQGNDFGMDLGFRVPIFDLKVSSQKSSPFSTVVQNELAKELYGLGFFRPDLADQALAALDLMDFEGKEKVIKKVSENQTLYQMVQQLSQLSMAMAAQIDATSGGATNYAESAAQIVAMTSQQTPAGAASTSSKAEPMEVNALGAAVNKGRSKTAGAARKKAAESSTPKS